MGHDLRLLAKSTPYAYWGPARHRGTDQNSCGNFAANLKGAATSILPQAE